MQNIIITSYSAIDKGKKRDRNEDYLLIYEPENKKIYKKKGNFYLIADGIGGLDKGELASKIASEIIKKIYYSRKLSSIKNSLIYAIKKANIKINSISMNKMEMGTTVVCTVIKDRKAYIASVGDSRAYLLRKGKLKRLTEDHSFVGERVRAGDLTEEEARIHPRKNIILRYLGEKENIDIDVFTCSLQVGDKILLCSDGLWGEIPHKKLEKIIKKDSIKSIVMLIRNANKAGGTDNISVILIEIEKR